MQRKRHFASSLGIAIATMLTLAASFSPPAIAAPAYYAFTGVIDSNHSEYGNLTSFSGLFSFDPLQADLAPADPDNGYYPMDSAVYGLSVTFLGGPMFMTDPANGYGAAVHVPLATPIGQPPDHGHFDLHGSVLGQVNRFVGLTFRNNFVTDALPGANGVFTLADFDQALFNYSGLAQAAPGPGDPVVPPYGISGHLTALTCVDGCVDGSGTVPNAVPEPRTMALVFAGLALPGMLLRRRRKPAA